MSIPTHGSKRYTGMTYCAPVADRAEGVPMSLPALSLSHFTLPAFGYAEVNGTKLYYEIRGDGPPLLLRHGFATNLELWRPQLDRLAQRHLVISYDARGFGRSANPGTRPYSHFADAAALCQHLGVQGVYGVGHAQGAHQLLELALARPGLLAGLCLLAPSGLSGLALPPDMARLERELLVAARTTGVSSARRLFAGAACSERRARTRRRARRSTSCFPAILVGTGPTKAPNAASRRRWPFSSTRSGCRRWWSRARATSRITTVWHGRWCAVSLAAAGGAGGRAPRRPRGAGRRQSGDLGLCRRAGDAAATCQRFLLKHAPDDSSALQSGITRSGLPRNSKCMVSRSWGSRPSQ